LPDLDPTPLDPVIEAEELRERGLRLCLRAQSVVLEIGFGRAEAPIEMARAAPDRVFLGVEVSRKRVHRAGRRVARAGIQNLRLIHATAEYLLERVLPDRCVSECWINFPDPWPKKRHHKRRLIRPDVVRQLARVLEPGALLHVSTDHREYAEWIAEVMETVPGFVSLHAGRWASVRPARPETGYEADFLAEGRTIAYFDYRRKETVPCRSKPAEVGR
jgi:tRNA (guanine-N7-)-methyltransferase